MQMFGTFFCTTQYLVIYVCYKVHTAIVYVALRLFMHGIRSHHISQYVV